MTLRLDRNAFRSQMAGKSISVEDAARTPGLRDSPAMQRAFARAAGADGVLSGPEEVDRLYGELNRWFNDKNPLHFWDRSLHMRPGGATDRAVQGLKAAGGIRPARGIARLSPAEAAEQSLSTTTRTHQSLRRTRGVGTHYGDASDFAGLDAAGKEKYLAEKTQAGQTPPSPGELTSSSCIGWAMEHVGAWYKAAGKEGRWAELQSTLQADNLRGTTLARELQRDGWKAYYNNPDTRRETEDTEHRYTDHVAKTQGTYYGIPLDGRMTDWAQDKTQLAPVDKAPFFVHVARGGLHVTAGTRGQVNELARKAGPDAQAIYQDPMANIIDEYAAVYGGGDAGRERAMHMWGSGVTLVPPEATP